MEDVLLHSVGFDDQPMDVDFHPTQRLLATGVIDGHLLLHAFDAAAATARHRLKAHGGSCRAVRFALSGDLVYTASTDQSVLAVDVETGKATARKKAAHDTAINRLAAVGEAVTASGDDAGTLKLWDARQSGAVASLEPHADYISDLAMHAAEHALVSVAGDGTLAVTDLRTRKVRARSEGDSDDDLLSVAVLRGGKKLVCGTTSGVLAVWSWGYWNDSSDRFPGHPQSVDALLPYDDSTFLTGSSDGMIRILTLQPNAMLGVLGAHGEYPIEHMALTADRAFLASASHDNTVRLWDLSVLQDDDDDDEEEEEGEEDAEAVAGGGEAGGAEAGARAGAEAGAAGAAAAKPSEAAAAAAAAAGEKSEEDSDGDSDDSDGGGKRKRRKKEKRKRGAHRIPSKQQQRHTGSGDFFAGLL